MSNSSHNSLSAERAPALEQNRRETTVSSEQGSHLSELSSGVRPPRREAAVRCSHRVHQLYCGHKRRNQSISNDETPSLPKRSRKTTLKTTEQALCDPSENQDADNTDFEVNSTQTCSICLACVENRCVALNCEHEFCKTCLLEWVTKSSSTCPICRANIVKIRYGFTKSGKYKEMPVSHHEGRGAGPLTELMDRFSMFVDIFFTSNTTEMSNVFDEMINAMVPAVEMVSNGVSTVTTAAQTERSLFGPIRTPRMTVNNSGRRSRTTVYDRQRPSAQNTGASSARHASQRHMRTAVRRSTTATGAPSTLLSTVVHSSIANNQPVNDLINDTNSDIVVLDVQPVEITINGNGDSSDTQESQGVATRRRRGARMSISTHTNTLPQNLTE